MNTQATPISEAPCEYLIEKRFDSCVTSSFLLAEHLDGHSFSCPLLSIVFSLPMIST